MVRPMGEKLVRCGCGTARHTDDPELAQAPTRTGAIGFIEIQPPRLFNQRLGPEPHARFPRACRQCGAIYLPRRDTL